MIEKRVEIKKSRGVFEIFFINLEGARRKIVVGSDFKKAKQLSNRIDTWLARGLEPEKELAKLQAMKTAAPKELNAEAPTSVRLSDGIDRNIYARLKEVSDSTGRSMSDIVNEALSSFLDSLTFAPVVDIEKEIDTVRAGTVLRGEAALDLFIRLFLPEIGAGSFIPYIGKWVTTTTGTASKRSEAEAESIMLALEDANDDALRSMIVGGEIEQIDYTNRDSSEDGCYSISARQKANTYNVAFEDAILYYRKPVVDPVTNNAPRTYMYLLGTPFNIPINMLVFYHTDV